MEEAQHTEKKKIRHGTPNNLDTRAAIEALEYLLAAGYVNKKRLYFANFMRGIFFSIGTIVGIAIISSVVIGILAQFDDAPLIDNVRQQVEKAVNVQSKSSTSE